MTKLEKLNLFTNFWFLPWGAAKSKAWETFSLDQPFTEALGERACEQILEGSDRFNWTELENFIYWKSR